MPVRKRVGRVEATVLSSEPDDSTVETSRPDIAEIAAEIMLERALGCPIAQAAPMAADGQIALLLIPDPAWREPVIEVWRGKLRAGERYRAGTGRSYYDRYSFAVIAPERQPRPSDLASDLDLLAETSAAGQHCLVVVSALDWVAPEIVAMTDHTVHLTALTTDDIRTIIRRVRGRGPKRAMGEVQAAMVLPKHLRLADRGPRQSATQLVQRLSRLLDVGSTALRPPPQTEGPRAAPTLDRLHGMPEAVAWGRQLASDLLLYRAGRLAWSGVDRGCLLTGPPGCGKTLFARALVTSCDAALVVGSYGQWLATGTGHQGDLLRAMRAAFADARTKAPCILFIDEIDSFPNRSAVTHYPEWHTEIVNALLAELDGATDREGVVVIGACNAPQRLDPALVRSGRLDRHIRIGRPDHDALVQILREHLGSDLADQDLSSAASRALGSNGADIERVVRGARRRARDGQRDLTMVDLLAEIGGDDLDAVEAWPAAIHEAGHAVLAVALRPGTLKGVVLGAQGTASGFAVFQGSPPRSAEDIRQLLVVQLGGRAAEQVVFGQPSCGSGGDGDSDLAQATLLATTAAAAMGCDEALGLAWLGMPELSSLPKMLAADAMLARRVRQALAEAYGRALDLLASRRAAVEVLAIALMNSRALNGMEATAIIAAQGLDGAAPFAATPPGAGRRRLEDSHDGQCRPAAARADRKEAVGGAEPLATGRNRRQPAPVWLRDPAHRHRRLVLATLHHNRLDGERPNRRPNHQRDCISPRRTDHRGRP